MWDRGESKLPGDTKLFQPCYVEVLCGAGDLIPRISRVVRDDLGVPVYSGAGFDSLKGKRAFAKRAAERQVPTFVLNVGDYDGDAAHGQNIYAPPPRTRSRGRRRRASRDTSCRSTATWA